MSHTTKTRLLLIGWLLAVVAVLWFNYEKRGAWAVGVFISGYAAKSLYFWIGEYANQYWR